MKKLYMLAILIFFTTFGCKTSLTPSEIYGIWQAPIATGTETQQFNQNGTVVESSDTFAEMDGTWAVSGNTLSLAFSGVSSSYIFSFSGDTTLIETPTGVGPVLTFTRLKNF